MLTQVKRLKQKWLSVSKPVVGDPDALVFFAAERMPVFVLELEAE